MLANSSSLTEANHSGDTALHLAAYGGHRHLVEWLLVRWGGWTHPVVVEFHVQLLEHGHVSGGAGRAAKRARHR